MKHLILFIIAFFASITVFSQENIEKVMAEIEKNNTTLKAVRKSIEAEKTGNKSEIFLQDPEAEFNYLWGNPSVIGNRTDISIKQTFDFPTAYGYKIQLSDLKNEQVEQDYQRHRKAILLQSRLLCVELIHINALKSVFTERLAHAGQIANSYRLKFEAGEANIMDYNKSGINLLNMKKEVESYEIERALLLANLATLNGGISIDLTDSAFSTQIIEADFETWYLQAEQNNPVLAWLKHEIVIRQKEEKLSGALSLPKFGAGYMSEKVPGQHFQGMTLGVSIPLWENKNRVKYAKAKTMAAQSIEADSRLQYYNRLKGLHAKVAGLQTSFADYRNNLMEFSHTELLQKALNAGEISLAEYFLELSVYYESINRLLDMEKELNKSTVELNMSF